MPVRRRLTQSYVDRLRPTRRGERWVQDISVRGFGVRIWPGGKSYCIRGRTKDGRQFRETLAPASGHILDAVRRRASVQLLCARGLERRLPARERWKIWLQSHSLDNWVDKVLDVQKYGGSTEQYLCDTRQRYAVHIGPFIGKRVLKDVTLEDVRECLERMPERKALRRALRSFLHLVFSFAGEFNDQYWRISRRISEIDLGSYDPHADPRLDLGPKTFERLFRRLSSEREFRQEALFLILLFQLTIRPKELLRAQWSQFDGGWFCPKRRSDWRAELDKIRLDPTTKEILRRIRRLNEDLVRDSPFVFPSTRAPKTGHLTSYKRYWRLLQHDFDLPDASLYEVVRSVGRPLYSHFKQLGFAPSSIKAIVSTVRHTR